MSTAASNLAASQAGLVLAHIPELRTADQWAAWLRVLAETSQYVQGARPDEIGTH